jgi:hypothetical protein
MSIGRQPLLDVGNTDLTVDWAVDQKRFPFRQTLGGDFQIRERYSCQK